MIRKTPKAKTILALTPFTREDWYGYAGCEPFPDGSQPLVGYAGDRVTVVVDRNGINVECYTDDGGEVYSYSWTPGTDVVPPKAMLTLIASHLPLDPADDAGTVAALEALGFEKF